MPQPGEHGRLGPALQRDAAGEGAALLPELPVHDRMPVILPRQDWSAWLDPQTQGAAAVAPLLRPCPADALRAYPVGPLVNNPRNDRPGCLTAAV